MDLPRVYFPVRVCPHHGEEGAKEMSFSDYGSCSNVIDFDSGHKCAPQRGHGRIDGLDRILPMLPLTDSLKVKDSKEQLDTILGFDNYSNLFKQLDGFFRKYNASKLKLSPLNRSNGIAHYLESKEKFLKFREKYESLKDQPGSAINLKDSFETLLGSLRVWVKGLYQHYSWFQTAHSNDSFKGFNRDFYKGLLSSMDAEDPSSSVLFHAGGDDFRDIYKTWVSTDIKTNLKRVKKTKKFSLGEPTYQISSSKKGVLCMRHRRECTVVNQKTFKTAVNITVDDDLSDVCPSPFIANEILLSERCGTVSLWDINSNELDACRPLKERQSDSGSSDSWTSSYFSGHPRQIVIADTKSVKLFDHRDSFLKGSRLFDLSPTLVKGNNQVMSAISLDYPYHAVGTDEAIFMMDQRLPGSPVFQWHLDRMRHPLMLHFTKFSSDIFHGFKSNACIFVATQQPREILCLPVAIDGEAAPRSFILPWQAGKSRTMFEEESQSMGIDWPDIKEKFDMPMAGMTVINEEAAGKQAFSIYESDSMGDIFYQQFQITEIAEGDQSVRHRLWEPSHQTVEAARRRVHNCISHINSLKLSNEPESHPEVLKEDLSKPPLKFSDVCEMFKTAEVDEKDVAEETSYSNYASFGKDFRTWESLNFGKVNTQLHIALKEGGDITTLLEEREKDHEEKKAGMRISVLKRLTKKAKRKLSTESDNLLQLSLNKKTET